MRRFAEALGRILKSLPLALIAPVLLFVTAIALGLIDLLVRRSVPSEQPASEAANPRGMSIVIPNWNGRDLLEKYLPSVIAAASRRHGTEILVVDNGSADGSAEFLRKTFPAIRVLALPKNLGFGGGSNAGFKAASNDVVVLLNSDMRVEEDFLAPLAAAFTDDLVFAVSCQIFFSDPNKKREETGLTEGWWHQGFVRVGHRIDPAVGEPFPCFYGGGGSCAFDRNKFLELGGFDEVLAPFYLEDTDLGYMAWKRGWKVLYQPASVVYHEHRGTIGRRFSESYIQGVLKKNFLLFTWKNIHDWRMLSSHFLFAWAGAMVSWIFGGSPERATLAGIARAFLQLPAAMRARARARRLAVISDREAFRRPRGGHFRDTFGPRSNEKLRVLFVSPYPIWPPVHGGAVFMNQTVRELARLTELHLIVLLDYPHERKAHEEMERICASVEYIVRMEGHSKALGSIEPHAIREFRNPDLAWLIHRQIFLKRIDAVQLEYTVLGQYAGGFRRIPSILFEHDIYFQSIARRLPFMHGALTRVKARWEYLRALRYELRMLPHADRVQVCSEENARYLESFLPQLSGRVDAEFRAGIDTSLYEFRPGGREPFTMLFLGSFRHLPNVEALEWFVRHVLPLVRSREPRARLVLIGSDPPPRHSLPEADAIELVGFVEDIREALARYAVFVCPILSGSGVRVKLLEAFAAGIPVISTRIGAEGLASVDGEICALADDPQGFADRVLRLIEEPGKAAELARRARRFVCEKRDMRAMTAKLVECYRAEVEKRNTPG